MLWLNLISVKRTQFANGTKEIRALAPNLNARER